LATIIEQKKEKKVCGHSLEEAIRNVNRKHYNIEKRTSEKKLEFTAKQILHLI